VTCSSAIRLGPVPAASPKAVVAHHGIALRIKF